MGTFHRLQKHKCLSKPKNYTAIGKKTGGNFGLAAAESGIGVACLLDVFVNQGIASGALVQAYADWVAPVKTFYLVTPKARADSAKVRAFSDFLLEVFDSARKFCSPRTVPVKALAER